MTRPSSIWRHFDLWLTAAVLLLTGYGILMIRSAITGAPAYEGYEQLQLLFAAGGVVVMLVVAAIDYRYLTSGHWFLYLGLIASLIFVAIGGAINNDARSWISLGFIQVQPSEFGRILLAITFAQFLASRRHLINRFSNTILSLVYVAIPVALIFIQPDLGMSILFIAMWFIMIWLAGLPLHHFFILAAAGIGGALFMLPYLHEYQRQRIEAFFNPEVLPDQAYNLDQALISIGSGGWFGKGYLQGTQSQLGYLRVQHTDFIFSMLTEEMGVIFGSLVVLGLITFILFRLLRIATITPDPVGRYIVAGIAGVLLFQTFVSVGMNLRLIPATGLTLPFVSYGGSSLVSLFIGIGVAQSVLMRHKKQEFG